jgi:hypothetical protein
VIAGSVTIHALLSKGDVKIASSSRQPVQQHLGLFQIKGVEAFGEPVVYWGEKIAGFISLALIAPERRTRAGGCGRSRRCGPLEDGDAAFKLGDYATALRLLRLPWAKR